MLAAAALAESAVSGGGNADGSFFDWDSCGVRAGSVVSAADATAAALSSDAAYT